MESNRTEILKLIHTNPAVRLIWDYLRLKRAAGDHNPMADPLVKAGIESLQRSHGVELPAGVDWWTEPHWDTEQQTLKGF